MHDGPGATRLHGNIIAAITAGVAAAVWGGIARLVADYERAFGPLLVAVAGGNAERLRLLRCRPALADRWLALAGIHRAVLHPSSGTA